MHNINMKNTSSSADSQRKIKTFVKRGKKGDLITGGQPKTRKVTKNPKK